MRRRGFTLFQLLALLAILAILLGLLLPAIQKVREAAARAQSQNNLKQLAIGCHAYADTNASLPCGVDARNFSAQVRLLPFIEQDNLFKTIDFDKALTDKDNSAARSTRIRTFLSPLDPVEAVNQDWGATNYLFNAGSKASLADNDGICYRDSAVKFTDIKDGTSNTLLMVETLKGDGVDKPGSIKRRHVRLKEAELKDLTDDSGVKDFKDGKHIVGDRGASWMDGRFLQGTFALNRSVNDEKPDVDCEGAGGLSSIRPSGTTALVSRCDGSVTGLSPDIKVDVLKALATRDGGEVIDANDL